MEKSKWENRLLNAFQLIKNGKQIGHLKFDEFAELMDKHHDYNGDVERHLNKVNIKNEYN